LKNGKVTGLNNMMAEELKHFGPKALDWLLQLFNTCLAMMRIPKIWLRSRVVALLKSGKNLSLAKSYRPISLLILQANGASDTSSNIKLDSALASQQLHNS